METSLPEAFAAPTVCAAFQITAAASADAVALRTRGDATRITWRDYAARIRRIAGGLAGLGVRGGDTVAILLINRPEFNLVDTAAIHLGAIPFSIYVTSTVEQIRYLLEDSGACSRIPARASRSRSARSWRGCARRRLARRCARSSW